MTIRYARVELIPQHADDAITLISRSVNDVESGKGAEVLDAKVDSQRKSFESVIRLALRKMHCYSCKRNQRANDTGDMSAATALNFWLLREGTCPQHYFM